MRRPGKELSEEEEEDTTVIPRPSSPGKNTGPAPLLHLLLLRPTVKYLEVLTGKRSARR